MNSMRRPKVVLAMLDGLINSAFSAVHLERLATVGELLDPRPLTRLDDDRATELLRDADVLLGHWGCPTLTQSVVDRAPELKLFAYAAGTVKWQVTDAVFARDILVTSAAAANAVPVAEFTVAMILLVNKGVLLIREQLRDPNATVSVDRSRIGNVGKRIGIVGASHVGRLVIELLRPYSLDVVVFDPYLSDDEAARLGVAVERHLDALCESCDVVSLHAPDIPETRGMIGARQIRALRDGAVLVNTARPALVDQAALLEELRTARISAVLDVTDPEPIPSDHPLLALANVFVTPHIAGSLGTELHRMADYAVDEIERFARGEPPRFPVTKADLDRIA
jgi:phosphoglycerate dehydrogenase-like enzyme